MAAKPVVCIDRDGTIIVEKNYLCDPDQVELESGAVEGLAKLRDMGLRLVGITNQSGVGRGMFDIDAVHAVNRRVDEYLAVHGIAIVQWFICPHVAADHCNCRKPNVGLILQAKNQLDIDPQGCFVIGDKRSDAEIGPKFGGHGIIVTTGHSVGHVYETSNDFSVVSNLVEAADVVRRSILGDSV